MIENVNNKKDQRTVHRNLLMECNDLPKHVFDDAKRSNEQKKQVNRKVTDTEDLEEADDENIAVFVHEDVAASLRGGGGSIELLQLRMILLQLVVLWTYVMFLS